MKVLRKKSILRTLYVLIVFSILGSLAIYMFFPRSFDTIQESLISICGRIFISFLGLLFILVGIYCLIQSIRGQGEKKLWHYINNSSNPEYTRARIENFLSTASKMENFYYDENYILGHYDKALIFGETEKLVWAYKHSSKIIVYFITVGYQYHITLVFTDGTKQTFDVLNEEMADNIIDALVPLCPKCIFDYSDSLQKIYEQSFSNFTCLKYYS